MPSYTKSTYEYTKLRKDFGRQVLFQMVPAHLLDSINPDKEQQNQYMLRNPVDREVQATMPQSEHETNTKELVIHEQGINHTEGGWPREIHLYNEEHIARHCRRVQHEDNYIRTVLHLTPQMEHYIDQNNAVDMYQTYFDNMCPQNPVEKYNIQIGNIFRDPLKRPVSCVVWTNEKKSKLAVAYRKDFSEDEIESKLKHVCYLWDVCRQTSPIYEFFPEHSCWQLACSPVDSNLMIAGLKNGTVNVFDIREGPNAILSSSVYSSHRAPITALLYTQSRTHSEFFTGSPDGQCLWWDIRNLSNPIDQLPMSVKLEPSEEPNLSNSEGVSSLQFDRGLPTKFLCGTESGLVINANRMGRSHSEILTCYWNAHSGPVRTVERSPCTLRMFITCGDWTVRIWSEEVRSAPIIVSKPYYHQVTDVAWAPLRYSSYMAICEGGMFYYWDLLRKYREPVSTLHISKHGLTKVKPHPEGNLIAVGDNHGTLFLLQPSENMIRSDSNDKVLMHQTYDRETRREHILDSRMKEIRLKVRMEEKMTHVQTEESVDEDEILQTTEEEYLKIVKEAQREMDTMSMLSSA